MKQASRGPLHKAAVSGQYELVKMLLGSDEDVDQRDQVLVSANRCLLILTFLSCFSRLLAEGCVWALLQHYMLCFQEPTQHSDWPDWPVLTGVIDRQQIFVFLKISISRSCSSVDCLSYVHTIPLYLSAPARGRESLVY